jgi:hypothetical protein
VDLNGSLPEAQIWKAIQAVLGEAGLKPVVK